MKEDLDILIVGAGVSGLAAASFYLYTHHTSTKLLILERDSVPGGVWNARRAYPGFWTQWTVGSAEYSDVPMEMPKKEDTYLNFFEARYTTQYLEKFVDKRSLRERLRCGIEVCRIERGPSGRGWVVDGLELATENVQKWKTKQLVVANGTTSIPKMPHLPNKNMFNGPILHQKSFGQSNIITNLAIKDVTVIGGGKSAADMVYACVKANKTVCWIIRKSGTGPGFLFSAKGKGPYKNAFEIGSTRLASTMSPSIYNADTWWTRSLHGTERGRKIVNALWEGADKETLEEARFDSREDAREGFDLLKPFTP